MLISNLTLKRINLNTMSIGESNFFIDLMNSKPVAMMLNTNQRYLLLATETQAASFIYPRITHSQHSLFVVKLSFMKIQTVDLFCFVVPCPLNCSGNGVCVYATCNCTPQWMGPTCAEGTVPFVLSFISKKKVNIFDSDTVRITAACSSDCGAPQGRGFCSNGLCVCSSLWTGSNCTERMNLLILILILLFLTTTTIIIIIMIIIFNIQILSVGRCPDDCSRNGNCTGPEGNYTCICQEFWTGDNCGTEKQ